jgi:transposase-like protein
MKRGRPVDIKRVMKVREYLNKGLNQAEVSRVMNTTRRQVFRWVEYINREGANLPDFVVDKNQERE